MASTIRVAVTGAARGVGHALVMRLGQTGPFGDLWQTDRLRLRPFRADDLVAMHALYGDADNLRYWSVPPSPDLDSTRKMMRWHLGFHPAHYVMWAVEENGDWLHECVLPNRLTAEQLQFWVQEQTAEIFR